MHVFYVLNIHVKFHLNWVLFTVWSINLFLYIILGHKNLKFRLCLFGVKITSRNAFPEMRLFGWSEKFYFPEIEIRWLKKKSLWPLKSFYTSIFPSKCFRKSISGSDFHPKQTQPKFKQLLNNSYYATIFFMVSSPNDLYCYLLITSK